MKKIYFSLLSVILFSGITLTLSAQRAEYVNQVITLSGGRFEVTPPFVDFATIQAYNPGTQVVNVFDTIFTQSVQDVVTHGNVGYAAAQDSIVMYNIDTYQRITAIPDSGLSKLYYYNGHLIITKQYPITRFFVEVVDASDLSVVARIDGISGECAGVTVANNMVYVAVNGGFLGTTGKIAIINPANWTLVNEVDFGPDAKGINNLYTYGAYIFSVNKTPYGGPVSGSITRYNYISQAFNTNILNVVVGDGFGLSKQYLYLKMNEGMGSYDLDAQTIADTTLVPDPGSAVNITIHAGAIDYLNELAYLTIGNRTTFSIGAVVTLEGDSVTTFATGVNSEAITIDFRNPAGIESKNASTFSVGPNPAGDFTIVRYTGLNASALKIYDLTGRTVFVKEISGTDGTVTVNCRDYQAGMYVAVLETAGGNKVQKFIKK